VAFHGREIDLKMATFSDWSAGNCSEINLIPRVLPAKVRAWVRGCSEISY
jgi:hypothetical protein